MYFDAIRSRQSINTFMAFCFVCLPRADRTLAMSNSKSAQLNITPIISKRLGLESPTLTLGEHVIKRACQIESSILRWLTPLTTACCRWTCVLCFMLYFLAALSSSNALHVPHKMHRFACCKAWSRHGPTINMDYS